MGRYDLSERFGIRVEEREDGFPAFVARTRGMRILLLADRNTERYALPMAEACGGTVFVFPSFEPVADEATIALARERAAGYDYLLAVGAGTLNDIAKYTAFSDGKACGCLATAPSMDGFSSSVTPLIEGGFKITREAKHVDDLLIDYEILAAAPKEMTGAGVGDILAKYCALADWRLAHRMYGEAYHEESAALMGEALSACVRSLDSIRAGGRQGIADLMNALLVSGYAMVLAGSSRPASGAEHHMSHFLEMDFLRRGERIPLHGVKVGLGTMVSLELYRRAKDFGFFVAAEEAERLPSPEWVKDVLASFGCPTRFSELGIPKETMISMLTDAWRIRDRFTVMTLYVKENRMREILPSLVELYY